MFKNKKITLFLVIFLIITFISSFVFADDENVTTENPTNTTVETTEGSAETSENHEHEGENTESSTPSTTANKEVHEGDLYLFENEVTMDKLVNGNVYIMAQTVNVTGQVAGNLFILANKVNFTDAYVESSTYICANEVNFKAVTSDLYVACNKLEIPSDYGVYRDLKCSCNDLTLLGIIGRNADLAINNLTLEKDSSKATVYGKFNYSSPKEATIPEGSVEGEVNFNKTEESKEEKKSFDIGSYIFGALQAIVFTLIVYGLFSLISKSSIEKCTKITEKKFLPAFGWGLLALIATPIASVLLLLTIVGAPLAVALLVVYGLLLSISGSVFTISIANIVCNKMNKSNKWMKILFVGLVSLVVYIIGCIPFVSILKGIITILGFGTLFMNIFFKNIKFNKEAK